MRTQTNRLSRPLGIFATLLFAAAPLVAFAHGGPHRPPPLSPATPATLIGNCEGLQAQLTGLPNTVITGSTTVAAGTIGSAGSPLYDLTFSTSLPNELSGPSAAPSAVCASPPLINFSGLAMRCINPAAAAGASSERTHPKARVRARNAPRG